MKKTNLPTFTEKRFITWDDVRSLCITKRWYTRGTNEQYSELAAFVEDLEEATTADLVIIANDILEHSDTKYDLEAILWELNKASNTQFVIA